MLRWLVRRKLDAEEKRLGESMDYLRHVVDASPAAFLRFACIMPFANSRRVLPAEAWFVAQIVAARHEDCGPCLQITVNLARDAGVDPELLQAALDGDRGALSPEMCDVFEFARAIVESTGDEGPLRETLRSRYGERGLIEFAYAIAGARIPPTVKRVLGYAQSCRLVSVSVDRTAD